MITVFGILKCARPRNQEMTDIILLYFNLGTVHKVTVALLALQDGYTINLHHLKQILKANRFFMLSN